MIRPSLKRETFASCKLDAMKIYLSTTWCQVAFGSYLGGEWGGATLNVVPQKNQSGLDARGESFSLLGGGLTIYCTRDGRAVGMEKYRQSQTSGDQSITRWFIEVVRSIVISSFQRWKVVGPLKRHLFCAAVLRSRTLLTSTRSGEEHHYTASSIRK